MSSGTIVPIAEQATNSWISSLNVIGSGSSSNSPPTGNIVGSGVTTETMAAVVESVRRTINNNAVSTTATATATATAAKSIVATVTATDDVLATTTATTMANVADLSASLQHFGFVDYFVFILMLVVCAIIGFYFGFIEKNKKKKNLAERRGSEALDYLVGGRKMKVFPVSLSLVASFISGISLLGTSTEVYVYGTQYAFVLISLAISGVISWYVFLPVFCNLQLTSTYEYFEKRFDRRVRIFGSGLFLLLALLWMPISIYVPALTFNQVTGINIHITTPILCTICTIYTSVGGIKGVVWTDVLQSFIMLAATAVVIVKGTIDVGGLGEVYRRNLESGRLVEPDRTFDPTVRMSYFSVIIGGAVFKLSVCSSQVAIQRFCCLPNMRAVKHALITFKIGLIFLLGLCVYLGLLSHASYYKCDPITTGLARAKDQIIPLYVMETVGKYPGLPGLFVSGVVSAALSSLSTVLNSLSGVILKDFIEPFRATPLSERQTAIILRSVVLLFGIISLVSVPIVEKLGMVMQLSATVASTTSGTLMGIFLVGMMLPHVNTKSVLAGGMLATTVVGYIALRAQIAIASGELTFPTKPVSIEGCTYEFIRTAAMNSSIYDSPKAIPSKGIHHLSFMLYCLVGTILTISGSILATYFFGKQDIHEVDEALLAPFVRRFLKTKKYKSVEQFAEENSDKTTKEIVFVFEDKFKKDENGEISKSS